MQKIFDILIQLLPTNCYRAAYKIKGNAKFKDVLDEIDDVLKCCEDHRVVNEYLLWYMYKKCDYDFLQLKHVTESIFVDQNLLPSTDTQCKELQCRKGWRIKCRNINLIVHTAVYAFMKSCKYCNLCTCD